MEELLKDLVWEETPPPEEHSVQLSQEQIRAKITELEALLSPEAVKAERKHGTRIHRQILRDAVRTELMKTPLNINELIQVAHATIVADVVKKVEARLLTPEAIDALFKKVITEMIDTSFKAAAGKDAVNLRNMLTDMAKARCAEVIEKQFLITLKEATW